MLGRIISSHTNQSVLFKNSICRFNLSKTRCNKGFSFIEVLVAAFIFSSAILPLISLSIVNMQNTDTLHKQVTVLNALSNLSQNMAINSSYHKAAGKQSIYYQQSSYQLSRLGQCKTSLYDCFCKTTPSQVHDCYRFDCNDNELASYDTYQFSCLLAQHSEAFKINLNLEASRSDIEITHGDAIGSIEQLSMSMDI